MSMSISYKALGLCPEALLAKASRLSETSSFTCSEGLLSLSHSGLCFFTSCHLPHSCCGHYVCMLNVDHRTPRCLKRAARTDLLTDGNVCDALAITDTHLAVISTPLANTKHPTEDMLPYSA